MTDVAARRKGLSKSRLTAFEQCPRRLWLTVWRPDLAELDAGAQARFTAGHEVGAVACDLLPDGIMIDAEPNLTAALERTTALVQSGVRVPLFEATFQHEGVLVRVDVLEPDAADGWRMAEVKSSTSAKAYHLSDLATQVWVAEEAGLKISSAAIRHLDNTFVLEREGDLAGLFADTDCLAEIGPIIASREEVVSEARRVLEGEEPVRATGDHCHSPFNCEFKAWCDRASPSGPEWPVTILPYGGGKRWLNTGVTDLTVIDPAELTSPVHRRVYDATVSGQPWHDVGAARQAMADWGWPRAYLDFESIAFAVPRWVGTRPYQQVPFQFSLHVERQDGSVEHSEFLSLDGRDPRRACAEALVQLLPAEGAVIGYNSSFERSRIVELAEAFPDLEQPLRGLAARVVDLLPVARTCWYHRDQRGSWSIKALLPTVAPELDYANLEVKDGGQAQEAYLEAMRCIDPDRLAALDTGLRAYCRRDTEAMVVLAKRFCGSRSAPPSPDAETTPVSHPAAQGALSGDEL